MLIQNEPNQNKLIETIQKSRRNGERFLLSKQESDGAWRGEVDLNPGPTAQVIMLHAYTERELPARLKEKVLRYIKRMQNEDGGWSTHFGAPSDASVTCECYVALRLMGVAADDEACRKAREKIRALGGVERANPWTQLYCAVLGILPWKRIYKTPVEIMLIPEWMPIHISHLSYWVKVITIPMALLGAVGPGQPIAQAETLRAELHVDFQTFSPHLDSMFAKILIPAIETSLKAVPPVRKKAIARALNAIDQFTEKHGDFGGNTCTAMVVLLIKKCLGSSGQASFEQGFQCLMGYAHETSEEWRMQCCQSHVWDTAFALNALPSGRPEYQSAVAKGLAWLKQRQITKVAGPWNRNVDAQPGGWCFGDRHEHFPVTDCTAVSLMALNRHDSEFSSTANANLGVQWLASMQHSGGGWSAYEKYSHGMWLNKVVKFKDIEDALVDVPKGDVSSKVIEALAAFREHLPTSRAHLQDARKFLLSIRNSSGLWRGNYGINFVYGTAFAAKALRELDGKPSEDWAGPVRQFFFASQNADGGWGETEASYFDSSRAGEGPSSVVQTAWALLAVTACYSPETPEAPRLEESLARGVRFLIDRQQVDGSWQEPRFLGTVFPGAVYFRYDYYPYYFPLIALDTVEAAFQAKQAVTNSAT